ncbi:MAG: AMP-binding protein [Deltaproteobacteria bacterium]|jgi:acyl-[acyl-carrier-protein]-phospholipid O-acyltransferase/long-chain-fatty-acid--[acyl-carrier-protein] ligase|nr:AMP-binding protein [Deltaproteobacteria bacterium]
MSALRRILTKPTFWPLFGSMSLGAFNDNFFRQAMIAGLAFGTLSIGDGTLSDANKSVLGGLAMSLLILPFFLFSSLAGELADRYAKSTLIKLAKAFELVIALLAGYLFLVGQIIPLLVVLFFMGSQSALFGPLKYGLLPEILKKDELLGGNALVSGASFIAITLGSLAGTSLAVSAGGAGQAPTVSPVLPLGLIGVAFLGFLFALKQPPSVPGDPNLNLDRRLWRSTLSIVQSVWRRPEIFLPILGISWFWAMGSVVLTQLSILTESLMGGTIGVYAFLTGLFSVGVALGSISAQTLNQGRVSANLAPLAAGFLAIFMVGFALAAANLPSATANSVDLKLFLSSWSYQRLALTAFLVSVAGGLFVVPLNALIQRLAGPEERARVIAANNIFNSAFIVLGNVAVMGLVKLGFSLPQIFLVVALTALLTAFVCVKIIPQGPLLAIAAAFIQLIYRPKIKGLEHFDAKGPLLIVPNHVSFLDVALLTAFSPRTLTFAIDLNWSQVWWVKFFTHFFETIPVNPASPMTVRDLMKAVDAGRALVIFPEGRVTVTGSIMKIHEGPGLIAARCRVPVIPVIFEGLEYTVFARFIKKLRRKPRHVPIAMTVFPPRALDGERRPNEKRRDFRRRLTEAIYDLMVTASFETRDYHKNVWTALLEAKKIFGARPPILEDYRRRPLSYGSLIRQSRVLGRYLAQRTEPGERVGVLLPNSIALAVVLFGLWAGGRVPVVLNYSQGRGHLRSSLETAEVKTVITAQNFLSAIGSTWGLLEYGLSIVTLDEAKLRLGDKILGLFWRGRPTEASSPAAVVFTSGSEGRPKGVVLSHENLIANMYQASSIVPVNCDDVLFNAMPCFHAFGLNVGLVLPLLLGIRCLFYVSPLHLKAIPELIYDSQATIIIGSDAFAAAWAKNAHPYDFQTARFVLLGAEKIQQKTMDLYFQKFGVKLYEGYGVTEGSPIMAVNTPLRAKIGSVGHFLPGLEYRLEPTPGLAEGGRLLVKGPNIMLGYLRPENPGVIEAPKDGWHDTGDVIDVDSEGFVWIKGRLKRFAKIKGEMISLAFLEEIAAQAFPLDKTAVLSIIDADKGEKLLFVSENQKPDLAALRQAILDRGLTELSCPKNALTVPVIPLNPMGKVDFVKLGEMATAALAKPLVQK